MRQLRDVITEVEFKGNAIGHFNISNLEGFWAVVQAARTLKVPVIIGVSEGERDFIGIRQVRALVDSVQSDEFPVYLNADHTYSLDRIKEVVDANYDSVIIDEADKTIEENLKITKEAVEYSKSKNPNILVEAELGFIGKSSKILDEVPDGVSKITPDEAKEFVESTNLDLFAPAVGNVHGMVRDGREPRLDIDLISKIKDAVKIPLVLHGASGNGDDEIRAAIKTGISIIHINTELRVAYKSGLKKSLSDNPDEIAPYKYLRPALQEMQKVVEKKLRLFSGL